jgi:hypothetical protein
MSIALPKIRPGDRIVVCGRPEKAFVESIQKMSDGRVEIIVDWGEFGRSRVWEHERGEVWVPYVWLN